MTNRSKLARERAGLSAGQAAKLLGIDRDALVLYEESDAAFSTADHAALSDVYGVNLPWLRGEVPQHDYEHVDGIKGAGRLTEHDRDVLAEFVAAMPASTGTAEELLARIKAKRGAP